MSSPGSSLPPEGPNSPLSILTEVATPAAPLEATASVVQTGESTLASSTPGSPLASTAAVDVPASSAPVGPSPPMPVGLVGSKPVPCVGTFDPDHVYQTLAALQVTAETLARRVEASERRLALSPPSSRYWSARCGRLEQELLDASTRETQLRGKLQHEMDMVDHWRRHVNLQQSELILLAEKWRHADSFDEPQTGGASRPAASAGLPSLPGQSTQHAAVVPSKRPLGRSSRSSPKPAKRLKAVTSGKAVGPIAPNSSDACASTDSEEVRTAMARSRSSSRRSKKSAKIPTSLVPAVAVSSSALVVSTAPPSSSPSVAVGGGVFSVVD